MNKLNPNVLTIDILKNHMKYISLHGKYGEGKFTIVSDEDYENLNKKRWHLARAKKNSKMFYVVRNVWKGKKKIYIHKEILGHKKGYFTDHINRNPMDNRRENLRHVTPRQNVWNRSSYKIPKSGTFVEISDLYGAKKVGKKWCAGCKIKGIYKYIGTYITQKEAHEAYVLFIKRLGET